MKKRHRNAFTMMELVLVAAILAMLAYIAVPRVNNALRTFYKGSSFSQKLITDLRLARSTAIANAAVNNTGFSLQMTGSSPYTGYCIKNLLTDAVLFNYSIDSQIQCTGGTNFKFGPLGNLLTGSDSHLVISAGGKTTTIDIVAPTGAINYVEN